MGLHHHHGHGHDDHSGHSHGGSWRGPSGNKGRQRRALYGALALNGTLFFAELIGGYLTGSLALLSDAAHMFADVLALALSVFAIWISGKKASSSKTFGYYRAEVLAAFVNCLGLWVLMLFLFFEAFQRLQSPQPVHAGGMLGVATAGLLANLIGMALLHGHRHDNLNIKSSYLHLFADSLGSVAALAAAGAIAWTGDTRWDPMASFAIGGLTLYASWGLLKESVDILMESTPHRIDVEDLRTHMGEVAGVASVHDLHVWSLDSQKLALSAHAVVAAGTENAAVLRALAALLKDEFGIEHSTIQLEDAARAGEDCVDCNDGAGAADPKAG